VPELFDHHLRALRRDRAVRSGLETFLYDRAFDDCMDRLAAIRRRFSKVLLAGCPNPEWKGHFGAAEVSIVDPGLLMAERAGGQRADLETLPFDAEQFDLIVTIGLLDSANQLPLAAAGLNLILKPGGLLLGAIAGGHSLPSLRRAMLAGDASTGQATPHVHPRIEAPALAQLLTAAGFLEPVIDIDRVELSYGTLDSLISDLRAMGMTNVLKARSRHPLSRRALLAARSAFLEGAERTLEHVEILHFAAWKSEAGT
jgi:SAM-dependent methyltransferase